MKLTLLSGKKWAKSVQGGSSVELKVRPSMIDGVVLALKRHAYF
jgi:hypothetical protein